jgi:hypothetical protein
LNRAEIARDYVGVEAPPKCEVELLARSTSATGTTTTSNFMSMRRGCLPWGPVRTSRTPWPDVSLDVQGFTRDVRAPRRIPGEN